MSFFFKFFARGMGWFEFKIILYHNKFRQNHSACFNFFQIKKKLKINKGTFKCRRKSDSNFLYWLNRYDFTNYILFGIEKQQGVKYYSLRLLNLIYCINNILFTFIALVT